MDNKNPEKINQTGLEEKKESKPLRNPSNSGALVIKKDEIAILVGLIAFAALLFSIVLLTTLFGGPSVKDDVHFHTFSTNISSADGKFDLVKSCMDCDFYEYIERDVKGVTVLAERLPTCVSDGKRIFSLDRDGETVFYEEIMKMTGHKINGINVDELRNEDGHLIYDGEYVKTIGDVKFVCGEVVEAGVYACSECKELCQTAFIANHIPADKWVKEDEAKPTCTESGKEVLYCTVCDNVMEEKIISALGHSYNRTLVWDSNTQKFLINSFCKKGCGETKSEEAVGVKEAMREAATCGTPEKIYYQVNAEGELLEYVKSVGAANGTHSFGIDTDSDVCDYVEDVTIPLFGNSAGEIVCGSISESFFVKCTECGTPKKVSVKISGHEYRLKSIKKLPDFNNGGVITVICKHSKWCSYEVDVSVDSLEVGVNAELVPGTESTYLYRTEINGTVIEFKVPVS